MSVRNQPKNLCCTYRLQSLRPYLHPSVIGQSQPAAAGTALGASFVRVAYLAHLIQCALGRALHCSFSPKLHALVGELDEARLADITVGFRALRLLQGGHQGRDGEPHDEADEEVEPRELERARMRAAEPEHGTDLLGLTVPELAKVVAVPSEEAHDLAILGVVAGLVPVGGLPDRLRREIAHRVRVVFAAFADGVLTAFLSNKRSPSRSA